MCTHALILTILLVLLFAATAPLSAQVDYSTATLRGTILDPQGLLVAGASIRISNPGTGWSRLVQTGGDGVYRVPLLPPGTYKLWVQAAGFAAASVNVTVSVGEIANCGVHLKLGSASETVKVSEQSQLVQAEQTQQANTIGSHQIAELPNLTRLFTDLVFTLPGVSSSEAPRSQTPGFSGFPSSGSSIGGSNGRHNLVTIDGGENDLGVGALRTPHVPWTRFRLRPSHSCSITLVWHLCKPSNGNPHQGFRKGGKETLAEHQGLQRLACLLLRRPYPDDRITAGLT